MDSRPRVAVNRFLLVFVLSFSLSVASIVASECECCALVCVRSCMLLISFGSAASCGGRRGRCSRPLPESILSRRRASPAQPSTAAGMRLHADQRDASSSSHNGPGRFEERSGEEREWRKTEDAGAGKGAADSGAAAESHSRQRSEDTISLAASSQQAVLTDSGSMLTLSTDVGCDSARLQPSDG